VDVGRAGITDVASFWRSQELLDRIRILQPDIIVNNRLGIPADLDTPEQQITASQSGRGWESCMTIGDENAWGYSSHNPVRKTLGQLLRGLSQAAAGEGNFILNTGPLGDGSIDTEDAVLLRQMGDWLRVHGEAIYNSRAFSYDASWYAQGIFTRQGNTLFLHVLRWSDGEIFLPLFKSIPLRGTLLTTGQSLDIQQLSNGRLRLSGLPRLPPHPAHTVIRLEFDHDPQLLPEPDHAAWLEGQAGN
jgi:alpha-L-fucosidase